MASILPADPPFAERGNRNACFIAVGGAAISQCSPRSAFVSNVQFKNSWLP
jgi:hypothetical protein